MAARKNSPRHQTVGDCLKKIERAAKGSEVLFRGQASAEWPLESSAVRRIARSIEAGGRLDDFVVDIESTINSQQSLLEDARKFGFGRQDGRDLSDIELLTELQHFNAATVLLDFTENPIVAMYFACQGENDEDGKVFCLPRGSLNPAEDSQTIDTLISSQMTLQWVPVIRGFAERRIIKQSSVLLLNLPKDEEDIESVVIKKDDKRRLIKELRDIYKVSADNLFNDLSGFANSRSVDVGYDDAFTKFYRGMNLVHERDYAGALLKYSEAINENQGIWEAYNNRGNVHSILQDNKAAIADFDTAIQLHSKSSESYSNRGLSKSRLGDQEGAIADYDIAISLDPNLPNAFENRGVAKLLNGDFNGALDDFNQSTALEPNMSNLAFTGALLAARGEEGFAEFYFEVIKDRIPMWREELYIFLDMTKPDFAVENIFQGNEAAVRFFQRCIELAEEKLGLQP